jgi:V8-like Glu-specific endopeptidase
VDRRSGDRPIDFRTTAAQPREDGGTGFLLPGGWLLTCWHVVPTENRAKDADIYFGARRNREGWREQGQIHQARARQGFFTGGSLGVNDWTLVRLDPSADLRQWGHVVLDPSLTVKPGNEACIIQHPGLKPAKIAEGTLQFTGTLTFSYAIETENGSSGAPVLNTFGEVIALHSRSNDSQTNAGIPITRIIEAIKNAHNSPWLEIERLSREIRLQVGLIMAAKNETLRSRFGVDGVDTLRGIAAQDSALSNPSRIAQIYCQIMERVDLPDSASGEQQPFLLIEELAAHSHPAALIVFATWLRALSAADAAMVSLEKLDKWILSAMSETQAKRRYGRWICREPDILPQS